MNWVCDMSFLEVWYVVHPKGIVEFQAGHAKRNQSVFFFFAAECDAAVGAHDQQFSATIPLDHQIPLYTMLTYPGQLIRM